MSCYLFYENIIEISHMPCCPNINTSYCKCMVCVRNLYSKILICTGRFQEGRRYIFNIIYLRFFTSYHTCFFTYIFESSSLDYNCIYITYWPQFTSEVWMSLTPVFVCLCDVFGATEDFSSKGIIRNIGSISGVFSSWHSCFTGYLRRVLSSRKNFISFLSKIMLLRIRKDSRMKMTKSLRDASPSQSKSKWLKFQNQLKYFWFLVKFPTWINVQWLMLIFGYSTISIFVALYMRWRSKYSVAYSKRIWII